MTVPPATVMAAPASLPTAPTPVRRGDRLLAVVPSPRAVFLIKRIARALISLAIVLCASFFMVHLVPGDPARAALGPTAPPGTVELLRQTLGLDLPISEQFGRYISGLFRGDLSVSVSTQRPVAATLAERLPATLVLAVVSFIVAALGAFPIGVATAVSARGGRHRTIDLGVSSLLGFIIAVPNFLLAVVLIWLFSIVVPLAPSAGWGTVPHAVLPVLALAIGPLVYLARIVHVEMVRVLDAPYLTTARSKRLPSHLLYLRHALPNIVTATLTAGGVVLTGLVAGTVLIETVFVIPGIGSTIVSSITTKDYPLIQGVVLAYAVLVLAANLVVDLLLATLDPRSIVAEA